MFTGVVTLKRLGTTALVADQNNNISKIEYYIPKRGHSFLPNDRMFGTAKRHIRKNYRIYTPTEYENLIAEANEKFEIVRPKTKDIIDIKNGGRTIIRNWCYL